jgi:hypothetical protein
MNRDHSIFFSLFAGLMFFSGCVAPKYNYVPEYVDISEPPIGKIAQAYVGDTMVRQGKFSMQDAILLKEQVKVGSIGSYTFMPGYYSKQGEDAKSEYYLPSGGPNSGKVVKSALADPFQVIRRDKKSGKLCGVTVLNLEVCTSKANYTSTKIPVVAPDAFQQTLIYSGRVGERINIGYREFSNDYARPAFNNDVEYDLRESTVIGYKGAKIQVMEATNEYIKYRLISNFNDSLDFSLPEDVQPIEEDKEPVAI